MATRTLAEVKALFETGDKPTGAHFVDLIDTLHDEVGVGPQGPQGPQGVAGTNGAQGPQGPAGAAGSGGGSTSVAPVMVDLSTYGVNPYVNATYATQAAYAADPSAMWCPVCEVTANETSAGERGWYIADPVTPGQATWVSNVTFPDSPDLSIPAFVIGTDGAKLYLVYNNVAFPAATLGLYAAQGDLLSYVKFIPNEELYNVGDTITVISDNDPLFIAAPNRQGSLEEFGFGLGSGFRIYNQMAYTWTKVAPNDWTLTSPDMYLSANGTYSGWGNSIERNANGVLQRYTLSADEYTKLYNTSDYTVSVWIDYSQDNQTIADLQAQVNTLGEALFQLTSGLNAKSIIGFSGNE